MRMTLEQYGVAIRAAFEQGYVEGLYHPKNRHVIARMRECSAGFWTRVLSGLTATMRPERAVAIAVDKARSADFAVSPPNESSTSESLPDATGGETT